jgi:glycerophosphoryl diester phosphodiesterase
MPHPTRTRATLAVHVWTVNDADDMRWLLRWGVDWIMTDGPTLLERVLAKFKRKGDR